MSQADSEDSLKSSATMIETLAELSYERSDVGKQAKRWSKRKANYPRSVADGDGGAGFPPGPCGNDRGRKANGDNSVFNFEL